MTMLQSYKLLVFCCI